MKLGYYDCLKQLDGLAGYRYYIYAADQTECFAALEKLDYAVYDKLSETEGINGSKRDLIVALAKELGLNEDNSIADCFLKWLEPYAERYEMERFRLYSFSEFIKTLLAQVKRYGTDRFTNNKKLSHQKRFAALNNL